MMSWLILERDHSPALDAIISRKNQAHRIGINAVLLGKDARGECRVGIIIAHGHDGLGENRARVEIFVPQMHWAAPEFPSAFESLPLRLKAPKCRQWPRSTIRVCRPKAQ